MAPELGPLRRSSDRGSLVATVLLGLIVCGAVAAGYCYRHDLLRLLGSKSNLATATNQFAGTNQGPQAQALWTSNLDTVRIPEALAAGSIHGAEFRCEVSSLTGGALSLRQGKKWPPDLAVAVLLSGRHSEELSGKTFVVPPEHTPPVPMIIVRWKDAQGQAQKEEIAAGYAMKVSFGQATNGHMPGKIYLALPDEARSIIAGSFSAEIRKTSPQSVPQTRR